FVLSESGDLDAAMDRDAELVDPFGQDGFDLVLPDPEEIVVAAREVAELQGHVGERRLVVDPTLGEKTFGEAALVEGFERARVEAARASALERGGVAAFDDRDVDTGE